MKTFFEILLHNWDLFSTILAGLLTRYYEKKWTRKKLAEKIEQEIPYEFLTATEREKIKKVVNDLKA